ncbi:RNA-guided endonuclease IscB [Desulfobacter latus]|uniref:RRXRR domain-containing protein n=1 Tax=Desulfobacter latus TaxID=2292 RepID=A0A850TB50_9BACT|nr:RNA-guided endonuclease IscB [Desulfobacter latus]NWH06645.1 RRXRR domain-containing protein [Desulfobacter latus]
MSVFVLDTNKKPQNPIHPAKARLLLTEGTAAVFRQFPFTIILKEKVLDVASNPLRIKIDPGSRETGIAVINDDYRGQQIKNNLESRRAIRRSRRNRKTRYRKPRFDNRTRAKGCLPPSLKSRVHNIETWVNRLCRFCNIQAISMELVRFDMQKIQKNSSFQGKPGLLKRIQKQSKVPLKDAGAVNTTRWDLFRTLKKTGLPVETGSGGLTKFNRTTRGLHKTHWLDAACVGKSTPEKMFQIDKTVLILKADGHGSRQMCRVNRFGFPRTTAKSTEKKVKGFQTGDIVKAVVTSGKKVGTYTGRVAVRKSGSFNIKTVDKTVQGISWKYCRLLHASDGYSYNTTC